MLLFPLLAELYRGLFYGMGRDVTEVIEALPCPQNIKVHSSMCLKLLQLVQRIINIFPGIEASRPRCSSGLQALCTLRNGIEKAKLLLEHCCEDSKLYLAIKGEATLVRFKNTRNMLEQSLSSIQNNVPVILATEISPIISDLRGAIFSLDSVEEEAGKAMRTFLQNYASSNDSLYGTAIETLRFVFLSLRITSQRALLTERRSVKRLLDKVGDTEPSKKNILSRLLVLLKKHGKSVVNELSENSNVDSFPLSNTCNISADVQSHFMCGPNGLKNDTSGRGLAPEEYKCPISLRLMYDPVIISSGITFERMWVEKWFSEGHDTCPKTKSKLSDFSLISNTVMKELISKWCIANGVSVPNPRIESMEAQSWDTSLTSIASLSNSMNNLPPMDFSQVSVGSLDSGCLVSLHLKDSLRPGTIKIEDEPQGFHNYQKKCAVFDKLDELSWECQCKSVEDMKELTRHDCEGSQWLCVENFVMSLIRFLRKALDRREGKAQRTGTQLLFSFLTKSRSSLAELPEETYGLLASLLNYEVTNEALAVLEFLSHHPCCGSQILGSGALYPILEILETHTREFLEPAIKIINNLSLSTEICSFVVPSKFIPKLVPLIEEDSLSRYSISILRNMCQNEETRAIVAETSGCIASIAKLLETGTDEVQEHEIGTDEIQEHAVNILLSLCSQRVQYCQMVIKEGLVPPLSFVSRNGNDKGKAIATELLRLLREVVDLDDTQVSSRTNLDSSSYSFDHCEGKKSSSKGSWKFGIRFPNFSKTSSSASKTKK